MPFKFFKIWPRRQARRQERDGSPNPSAGDDSAQRSRMTMPNQTTTSHTQANVGDGNVSAIPDISASLQDNLSAILPQAPDLTADASQRLPSTNVAVASPSLPTPTPSSNLSCGKNMERLWSTAYDSLRVDEESTVRAYETLLIKKLEELNNDASLQAPIQITPATLKQPEHLEKFVAAGLEHSKKIATAKENIKEFGQVAQPVKAVMDVVVQAAPQAALAWSCVVSALQILANPLTESSVNREGITYVLMTMGWYRSLVDLLIDDDSRTQEIRTQLEDYIVNLYKRLLIYQMKSVCRYNRREIYVLLRDVVKLDDWEGKLADVKDAEERVHSKLEEYERLVIRESLKRSAKAMREHFSDLVSAIQEQTRAQQNAQDQSKRQDCLRALRQMVNPQDEKERIQDEKGNLLRDCYSWILTHERYLDWHQNRSTKLLWIAGDPGKGKTMLLCGIIDELERNPTNVLSYFFCQATQETLRNATAVLRGIIYGLAGKYPQLNRYISEKYENGGEAAFGGGTAWVVMRNILKAMLSDPHTDGVILIVDALDECVEGRQKLLEFISESSRAADSHVKWIVSSRNLPEIEKTIGGVMQHTSKLSLELNDRLVSDAVHKYIEQKVKDLAERPPFAGNQGLCNKVTDSLKKNSENTFLWVALVCSSLREGNVLEERHVSGSKGVLDEFPQGLDNLYHRMLKYITSDARDKDLCKHVLAVVSILKRHVSLQELCSIMEFSIDFDGKLETLESLIRCCGSFLNIRHGIVYFVHQSAVDFLHTDQKGALKEIFPHGINSMHRVVFVSSIKATSKVVCRNIYDLRDSDGREALGMHWDEITTPQSDPLAAIQYTSNHWIDHLRELGTKIHTDDREVVHQFLHNKFLYWVEALALLRQLSQAIQSIQKLQKMVAGTAIPDEEGLSEFLHDANRFLLYHRLTIENTPLQLYASALMFSPEESIVRKQFWFEAPDWVTVTQGVDAQWDACLQTLIGDRCRISSFAYSPDGQWLVSGDERGLVKLWHADSGTCVHTLDYHEEDSVEYQGLSNLIGNPSVMSVAFSADGQSFKSAYESGIVQTFDRARGDCIREVRALANSQEGTSWVAKSTAISKDSHTVAWHLGGEYINVLNMDIEAQPRTFRVHSDKVHAVALSADGLFLAASYDTRGDDNIDIWNSEVNIEIWDTSTQRSTQIIRTVDRPIRLIFSADGRWLATDARRSAVRVWESTTGQLALTLKHDADDDKNYRLPSIAFSDDGNLIATSYVSRICVWNTTTGAVVWKSDKCVENIHSLSFSPDALRLVSGSDDYRIKFWDLSKKTDNKPSSRFAQGLCYSDGLHFAACYPAVQEIEFWAGESGTDMAVRTFQKKNDVSLISLSPDHRSLASTSSKGIITVWDVETGDPKQTFGDSGESNSEITSLVFRGNSQLASGGFGTIDLWDTTEGRYKQRREQKGRHIKLMTFSTGGEWLAYNVIDRYHHRDRFMIWEIEEERCLPVLIKESFVTIKSLSFSADSQLLALASVDNIYLWDVRSRTCTKQFENRNGIRHIQVSFDANVQRRLHTQFGFLDFVGQDPNCMNANNSGDNRTYSEDSDNDIENLSGEKDSRGLLQFGGFGFTYDLDWVAQDQRKLIQIPVDYRASTLSNDMTPVIDDSTLIWISETGKLLRMHLKTRV